MPRYVTIGYGARSGYEQTPVEVRDAAHAHDARLAAAGAEVGVAGAPVQVRNPEGAGVTATTGPFMRSELPVAGFAIIDAASLEEAIDAVAGTPCAVAHGVVEIWPLDEPAGHG